MRALLSVLAAAVVAASTGCGDDQADGGAAVEAGGTFTLTEPGAATDASETRPEPDPDQSRWAREVDAACGQWQERLDALEPPENAAELEPFLAQALPLIRRQVEAVENVTPPEGTEEARRTERFVAGLRGVADALGRYRAAIEADDEAAAQQALAEAGEAGAETRARALELGVTACGGYAAG